MYLKQFLPTSILFAGIVSLSSCDRPSIEPITSDTKFPASASVDKSDLMATVGSVQVFNGGFGSAAAMHDGYIYLMTDRGPNIDGGKDEKIFSNPEFTPQIGKFKLDGETLKLVSIIDMKDPSGHKITGLPNPVGMGGSTGETPLDVSGKVLNTDKHGLDPEGLVIMSDGSFWLSDEYGPHIVHLDASGKELERINPFDTPRKIPAVFGSRRANRGMEGLAITPDGKYLVGMMQSPMYNPASESKAIKKNSLVCRMVFFELATGECKEYLYILDSKDMANSELVAVNNHTFLVLERDGNMPGRDASCSKLVYMIDTTGATDVTSTLASGRMIGDKTLEQCTPEEITAAGIKTVSKKLAFDIMSIPNYPHDKPEGLIVINENLLAIVNDDDFGVSGAGTYEQKYAPLLGANVVDKNIMYFVKPLIPLK